MRNKVIIIISIVIIAIAILVCVMSVNNKYNDNKSYITKDMKEKLLSLDTSDEEVSDTHYRNLSEEEINYIRTVCEDYDIDIDNSEAEFDITTDTYIIRTEESTLYIDLSTGEVDISYRRHIDY